MRVNTQDDLPPSQFHVLQPDKSTDIEGIGVFSFKWRQVNEVSLALKVSYEGKQILFSGDSAWTDQFRTHAHNVDLFSVNLRRTTGKCRIT